MFSAGPVLQSDQWVILAIMGSIDQQQACLWRQLERAEESPIPYETSKLANLVDVAEPEVWA